MFSDKQIKLQGAFLLDIAMAGIDHNKAGLEMRERFSFTKAAAKEAMILMREQAEAEGCVILSTCNRTEFWLSGAGNADPAVLLCKIKGESPDLCHSFFTVRRGEEAVRHLLRTACGMNSQLFGEDQIITQVRDAGDLARECGGSDTVLDTLFRTAVTAAKRVKTEVRLTAVHRSAAESTMELLHRELDSLSGKYALVIGNGAMGQLTAEKLLASGTKVVMTLRQYKSGSPRIPDGCMAISYDERFSAMENADIVVSATASPHYTIRYDAVTGLSRRSRIFIDLAVPRDIDPKVGDAAGAKLWDIDRLGAVGPDAGEKVASEHAMAILEEYWKEYYSWYCFREVVPLVRQISGKSAEDMTRRMEKCVHTLSLSPEQKDKLREEIGHHAEKTVAHLLFGLRETLPPELLQDCLKALNLV